MEMNELLALRARLWAAKMNGHLIGSAAGYVDALKQEAGPVDTQCWPNSPDHLLTLVEKVIAVRNAPKVQKAAKAPEKPKASPKPAQPKVDPKTASGILPEMPSEPPKKPAAK